MPDAVALTAVSMLDDSAQLDALRHTLANAGAPDFRLDVTSIERFGQLLSGELQTASSSPDLLGETATAHLSRRTEHSPGTLRLTHAPLDVAIEGDGFFA